MCSSAVTSAIASLDNLTANTSYEWKAYSDAGCTTEIAGESFSTLAGLALHITNIRQITATLTLSGYAGAWKYRGSQNNATLYRPDERHLGTGVAYADPWPGADVVGGCEGLLSRQEGEGGMGMGFREWGGSGSIRYERGGDDLGLTVALSPSWGGGKPRGSAVERVITLLPARPRHLHRRHAPQKRERHTRSRHPL